MKKEGTLDGTNYRKAARDAIGKYTEIGRIPDAIFWAQIIALYEADLKKRPK